MEVVHSNGAVLDDLVPGDTVMLDDTTASIPENGIKTQEVTDVLPASTLGLPLHVEPADAKVDPFALEESQQISNQVDTSTSHATGLCYDSRMRFHAVATTGDDHPEDPRRILHIYRAIQEADLISDASLSGHGKRPLRMIPARPATKDEILLVHNLDHWESMLATANMSNEQLVKLGAISDSVYFNNESAYCARLACGGAIETCKAVVEGRAKNAIAVIRPPGHHAEPDFASGFCLFNNVAVAVRTTMQNFPQVKKVLILDWDVHHGNGTQTAFFSDPNVLFISLHRYDNGTFYPGTTYGNLDKCGEGIGLGRNINIPWPTRGMGDADYLHAFDKAVMPIAREFNPDLVIISAGFDAAVGDPIGECLVTPTGYAHMTYQLMGLANGNCIAVLEGGYNLSSISVSALAVTKTLIGEAPGRLPDNQPSVRAIETVERVCLEQSKYWRCMAPLIYHTQPLYSQATRLHDVVRSHQAQILQKKYKMVALPLLEDRASASFENQALCTADFHTSETLLFFIHDAPEVLSNPQAGANTLALHESFMPDSASKILDWAAENKFGIIDINVPATLSGLDTEGQYTIATETTRLAKYIWDNYLELTDAKDIILMATGESCAGLVNMIAVKDVTDRVSAVINFYGRLSLKPLSSIEDSLIDWYYNNSLCFTTSDNEAWSAPKRPKRKFGKAIRGECTRMDELIHSSFGQATNFIQEAIEASD